MLLSNCVVCSNKNLRFIKKQEVSGILSSIGLKAPLSKIPFVGSKRHKINETISKYLLAGDKFMPGMHLRQSGVIYSACRTFTKNKEQIQNLIK